MLVNALNWFDIPVQDLDRAVDFYSVVLGKKMSRSELEGMENFAFLPSDGEGVGGALAYGEGYTPTESGSLVYLNGGDDLSAMLDRVVGAGGKVTMQKSSIGEHGFIAMFIDSEGNRVGLHSMS